MRKILKFLHTLAACGLIGALLGYMILLLAAPQDDAGSYADMRQSVSAICNYLLLPSLAVVLVTGLVSMIVHPPFLERRWVWIKAASGIGMFEGTLAVIGAKAGHATELAMQIAAGQAEQQVLEEAIAYEWHSLATIMALALANVVLGVWRPPLRKRAQPKQAG
jgi:hypothetical protein